MPENSDLLAVEERLNTNYALVAKDLLRITLENLHVVHSVFGGDFELFYILAVVALRTCEHRAFQDVPFAERVARGELPSLTTNVLSIAQSTGIPEETVRRKVRVLMGRGWVERTGRCLAYTPQGAQELTAVREALLGMAAGHYRVVGKLLKDAA